jgi:hypothetical protein
MRELIEHLRQTRAASEPSNQPSDRTNTHTGAVSTAICPSEDWQDKIAANYVVGVDLQCDCQRRGLRRVEELARFRVWRDVLFPCRRVVRYPGLFSGEAVCSPVSSLRRTSC